MKYSRFELLVLGVGVLSIAGTIAFSLSAKPDGIEILAQLLLLLPLTGAVHWGRNGGLLAAVLAFLLYLIARMPMILDAGWTLGTLQLVLIHGVTFGFIGIIGGELCGRLKYFFARSSESPTIDECSRVYNEHFIAQMLGALLGSWDRYSAPFSIVTLKVSDGVMSGLSHPRSSALVKAVANHLRNDVRMIDDVGRLNDGRFVLLLPHTPKAGAEIAGARVRSGIRDLVGAKDESLVVTVLGCSEDLDAIRALVAEISPTEESAETPVERRSVRQD